MELRASERVIEVICHPSQNGSLLYSNQSKLWLGINKIRKAKNIKEGTRKLAMVIEGVCGDGTSLEAPCIIFKAKEFQSE